MNYTKETCPVCQKQFTETDDIAVCPVCGTPHHRECYLEQKHCSNEGKHAEGFEWTPSEEQWLPHIEHVRNNDPSITGEVFCPFCGMKNSENNQICSYCGASLKDDSENAQNQDGRVFVPSAFGPDVIQIQPNDIISGHTVSDTAEFVQRNADKYIPKFYKMERRGQKLSFNWAAFLFAPYWFFYRKMHVIGFAIMVVSLLVSAICTTPDVTAAYNEYYNALSAFMQGSAALSQQELNDMAMNIQMMPEVMIDSAFTVLIHILSGFFANALYKRKVTKDISWAKENAVSPEQYRVMLFKKGGVSLMMLVLSVVGFYCAQQIIAMFLNGGM